MGAARINRSLKTACLTVARRLARTTAFEIEQQFEACREGREGRASQSRRTALSPHQTEIGVDARREPSIGLTLAQACENYLTDPTISRTQKSDIVYRSTFVTIADILGPETLLSAVSRDACRDVLSVLQRLPPNARKRWPGLSSREVADEAQKRGTPSMSTANVNEYMTKLSSMLNWAVKEELVARNPARGLRITDPIRARDKRYPFALWQLQRIFSAPLYVGCKNDEAGYARPGPNQPRRAKFWLPLLALWSGARMGELTQALTDDVREIDGILCLIISATSGDGKRLKTEASHRVIPIHPELLRTGFAAYVADRRRAKDARLFPDLTVDSLGLYSGKFSKWFGRFLRTCGATSERTCFHAFRHTFRDGLREAKIDRDVCLALGGWATTSGGDAVADAYGRGYSVPLLHSAISAISYPGLDLSHLHAE
jgi:integrase